VTLSGDKDADIGIGKEFLTRWDVASGQRLNGPVHISSHGIDVLLASPDGRRLVVVNGAETLVFAADSFRPLHRFSHHLRQPRAVAAALSPSDGRILALWPNNGPIQFLDLDSGRHRRRAASK
jgi:hypothetical protein